MVIAAIVFAIIAVTIFYAVELDRSRGKTKVMLSQLLDTVEYSAAIAAYANNEQIAKDVIQGLMRNDLVQEVSIMGNQGLSLKRTKYQVHDNSQNITRPLLSPFDTKRVIGNIAIVPKWDYNLK